MSDRSIFDNAMLAAIYAKAAGFTGDGLVTAVAVAGAESSYNPQAVGDKDNPAKGCASYGLWQINHCPGRDDGNANRGGTDPSSLLNPLTNARAAFAISSGGTSWTAWSTYTNGAYLKHTSEARKGIEQATDERVAQALSSGGTAFVGEGSKPVGPVDAAKAAAWAATHPVDAAKAAGSLAAQAASDVAGIVTDPLEAIGRLAGALLNPRTWLRVFLVLAGIAAIGAAASLIIADTSGVTIP